MQNESKRNKSIQIAIDRDHIFNKEEGTLSTDGVIVQLILIADEGSKDEKLKAIREILLDQFFQWISICQVFQGKKYIDWIYVDESN